MLHYVTITSQGQISIPAAIRRQFNLDKIRKAIVEVEEDKIVIRPEKDIFQLRGVFKTNKKIPFRKIREAFEEALARGEA